jgi:flagellar basal body-associated protein FliL
MHTRLTISALVMMHLALFCSGCGNSEPMEMLDAQALLDRYEQDRRRHDPNSFSEIDLGQFYVSLHQDPATYQVRFHIFGVIPDNQMSRFQDRIEPCTQRVRDAVISAVQRSEIDQLRDPSLGWLKAELLDAINQSLQMRILRDIVFTEFSFERN